MSGRGTLYPDRATNNTQSSRPHSSTDVSSAAGLSQAQAVYLCSEMVVDLYKACLDFLEEREPSRTQANADKYRSKVRRSVQTTRRRIKETFESSFDKDPQRYIAATQSWLIEKEARFDCTVGLNFVSWGPEGGGAVRKDGYMLKCWTSATPFSGEKLFWRQVLPSGTFKED